MTQKFKLVGTNDDANSCCCCGREGLKRVMWLVPLDCDGNPEGEAEHFGTSCAARMLGWGHPTSATTKRKLESEGVSAAETTIRLAIEKVRKDNCSLCNGMFFVLTTDMDAIAAGTLTPKEAIARLRQAHPITRYLDGTLSRDKALSMALKG